MSLCAETALAQHPSALSTISRTVNLPVVGLASSETAQVNVINLASSFMAATGAVPSEGTTASCTGGITFYNASGNIIGSSASFTIGSGQIFSATLPYSEISTSSTSASGRTSIRAVVAITGTNTAATPCSLASNVETFDTATGVTHVHAEGSTVSFASLLGILESVQSQGAAR
jgi:hypothetical protein